MDAIAELAGSPPDLSDRRVVCLPDFFVDHLVDAPDLTGLQDRIGEVAVAGGGNVPGVDQALFPGGQAANVARVLAGLGVDAALVAPTGPAGRALADRWLGPLGVDLDGLVEASTSLTVAFETSRANVMLNDAAGLADATFDDLGGEAVLEGADRVHVANWAQIGDGDAFLDAVLAACADARIPVSVDPGDPRPVDDHRLLEVLSRHPPDLVSVNEVEADALGLAPSTPVPTLPRGGPGPVVVHGADEATLVLADGTTVTASGLDVTPVRRTGAGDAFNAGLIVARLLDLEAWEMLALAHAVAAAAITSESHAVGWPDVADVVPA